MRGLREEIDEESGNAPVLQTLKDRAERILKDVGNRNITGLAAMEQLAALAKEKEEGLEAAKASGLSGRAFGVYWALRNDETLAAAGISPMQLAKESEVLITKFPNAKVKDDEQRRLRAALYIPLLGLDRESRGRTVDVVLGILLDGGSDVGE